MSRIALVLLVLTSGCRAKSGPVAATPSGGRTESTSWSYDVAAGPGARELAVDASFPAGSAAELTIDDGAEDFVRDVSVERDGRFEVIASRKADNRSWVVPACMSRGCKIRYRFLLAEAARTMDDPDIAMAHDEAYFAPPSTWLLRPASGPIGLPFQFRVTTPQGVAFATGVFPGSGAPNTYAADVSDLASSPYSGFGALAIVELQFGDRTLVVAKAPGTFTVGERAILDFVRASAETVAAYFGRFPVPRALLLLVPVSGGGSGFGKALGNGGASILFPIGEKTDSAALRSDWVLVHEMVHLGFPSLERRYLWLGEGIATYVEPFARARAGRLTTEEVWSGLVQGLSNGLPAPGDQGLDNTPTWGRIYWGGALFCLLADLEIRERTGNARSLDDALRAINEAGGTIASRWDISRVLEVGDLATGTGALRELHQKMGTAAYPVDLPKLWKRLGLNLTGGKISFDDRAELASVRRAMTKAP